MSDQTDNVVAFPARPTHAEPTDAELGTFRPDFIHDTARYLLTSSRRPAFDGDVRRVERPARIPRHPGDEVYLYGRGRIGEVRVQVGHHVLVAFPARLHEAPMTVWVARDFLMIRKAAELIAAGRRAP